MKLLLACLTVCAFILSAACTPGTYGAGTPSAGGSPSASGQNVNIDLVAQNIAFDKTTITVPAGAKVTINFDNRDQGIPHNFALYKDQNYTQAIFRGQNVTGPAKTTYNFTAPSTPGTYYFRCDVHPTQMTGQFIVQ